MASRALLLCSLVILAFAVGSEAKDFIVGDATDGWKVPAEPKALNKWASGKRFHPGDNLGKSRHHSRLNDVYNDRFLCIVDSTFF
jgi:hypothetical protein